VITVYSSNNNHTNYKKTSNNLFICIYKLIPFLIHFALRNLQPTQSQRQTAQNSVQKRHNTSKHNVQHHLNRDDQSRQTARQRRCENYKHAHTQNEDGGANSRKDFNDDEAEESGDGDGADLALLVVGRGGDEFCGCCALFDPRCVLVGEGGDLGSCGCDGRSDEVDLSADLSGGCGFVEDVGGWRQGGKGSVWIVSLKKVVMDGVERG
jgi:hypothetical protein